MYTVLMLIFTALSLASFLGILLGADPNFSDFFIHVLFFVTLFFTLTGVFTLLHLWISALLSKHISHATAFRRGFLLAMLSVSLVVLETLSLLNLANAVAVFLLVVSTEMFIIYKWKT